jgi:hypothetical protein
MEVVKINLNNSVDKLKYLVISDIINVSNGLLLTVKNDLFEITNNQSVVYLRKIQDTNGIYETITERGHIVDIIDKNHLIITKPSRKYYKITDIFEVDNSKVRIRFNEPINIFQQDIEESKQEIYFYNDNYELLYSSSSFCIPSKYDDRGINIDDCCVKSMDLKSCGKNCENDVLEIYDYYFISTATSRTDILLNENIDKIKNARFIKFKFTPFIYENDNKLFLFTDKWAEEIEGNTDKCKTYNIVDDYLVKIAIDDSYYKMGVAFDSSDNIKLGSEDDFGSSFINDLEQSLIPSFIDMEKIKYSPSKIVIKDGGKKYLKWASARGGNYCSDILFLYTETIPENEGKVNIPIYCYSNETNKIEEDTISKFNFYYEYSQSFENGKMAAINKIRDNYDVCKYYLTNEIYDENDNSITGLTFYLHFIKRKEIDYSERHLNSIYTSGNVYHDSWHVDQDNKETTWWNGFDYNGSNFDSSKFNKFNSYSGKTSDLIGYLNFTDDDIFYQKKKVSQSFLRLSFYSSNDPIEQKLLYYSTIFLDGGELYGKYIKQLSFLKEQGVLNGLINEQYKNALVVLEYGDNVTSTEGARVDTKIEVTNEYDRTKSSEGFNIYLFSEDKTFESENAEKTIYMKVEFNHAGNGKTIPLIMWPVDENGNFEALTTENYIKNLYIEVKVSYVNGRYVYYIPRAEEKDYNLHLVLYEPKLDKEKYHNILGTFDDRSKLPLKNNKNGDGYIVGNETYVWSGSEWKKYE